MKIHGAIRPSVSGTVVFCGAVLFTGLFFLPVGYFLYLSFTSGGSIAAALAGALSALPRVFSFTAGQSAVSALACCLLALPGAYIMARFDFPFKRFFLSLSLLPFILPSIIVIICMIGFYGKSGFLNTILGTDMNLVYSFRGIVIAHVFYNFSLAVRVISEGFMRIGPAYGEAAASLGDGKVRTFLRVTLPLLAPSIATAFILIFMYCFFSFGIVLVFGGVRYDNFESMIFKEMYVRLDLSRAAVFALFQLVCSGGFIVAAARTIRNGRNDGDRSRPAAERYPARIPPESRIPVILYGAVTVIFLLGPLLVPVIRSVTPAGSFTLKSFIALFRPDTSARDVGSILRTSVPNVIAVSIGLALLVGTITFLCALVLSLALRHRRNDNLDALFQIPMGVSGVTFGIGLRLLFRGAPYLPVIVMAQVFTAFPFVFRIVKTTVDSLRESYIESAKILGASNRAVITGIIIPFLKRGLQSAFAFGIAIPFADLTLVLSISRGEIATFPVAIYRLIGFRSFDLAISLSVLYIAVCLALFIWIDHTTEKKVL